MSVVRLLFGRSPTAISRRIRPIVFDAIQRTLGWTLAHIGKEIFKSKPAFANGDAATAIKFEIMRFWVVAARKHLRPRLMSARLLFSSLVTMLRVQAPTRFDMPISQINASDICGLAAIALAEPRRPSFYVCSTAFDYGKTVKTKTTNIRNGHRGLHSGCVSSGG
jgi:hypothetical protein